MNLQLATEAQGELDAFRAIDDMLVAGIEGCFDNLRLDADEFEAESDAGFSIEPVVALKRRGADVFRVRFDEFIPGIRILFFRHRRGVFVTGIHKREDLYDPLKAPMVRALNYWGRRRYL